MKNIIHPLEYIRDLTNDLLADLNHELTDLRSQDKSDQVFDIPDNDPDATFHNESGLEFTDISSELYRQYDFSCCTSVIIEAPQYLNVSESGGHRIFDSQGVSHYIPSGWVHLSWVSRPGLPNFVK